MIEVSAIIPFINETPQIVFTIQSLIEELTGFCEFEIIAVDNMSHDSFMCEAGRMEDKKFIPAPDGRKWPVRSRRYFHGPKGQIRTWFFRKGIIKYIQYDDSLGHWQAKNKGIEVSTGKYLFFLDAHCIMKRDSVRKMIQFLRDRPDEKIGGIHAYICYMLDSHPLEYEVKAKFFGYRFCSAQKRTEPYKVCVMSTCGMISPRSVIEELGGWSKELGIYGGGESYINWTQSTCGYPHWIHPEATCWHWADKRGYSWNHTDYMRNGMIAAYVVGDDKWLEQQIEAYQKKGNRDHVRNVGEDVRIKCAEDRVLIKSKQTETFDEFIERWQKDPKDGNR